jgi:hypothetical protein
VWLLGIEQIDAAAEQQGDGNPYGRHLQGFAYADLMLALAVSAEHLQIGIEHENDQSIEQHPDP